MTVSLFILSILSVTISRSESQYEPLHGYLLKMWNMPGSSFYSEVTAYGSLDLPDGVVGLHYCLTETEGDSLIIWLVGTASDSGGPLLLATGGYGEAYDLERGYLSYSAAQDEFRLRFYMPHSSRINDGYYRWELSNRRLAWLRFQTEDRSLEAFQQAESLLDLGDVAGGIEALNRVSHSQYYYDEDSMKVRLLRLVNDNAMSLYDEGDIAGAVELFDSLFDYNGMSAGWYRSHRDSSDFAECGYSSLMSIDEYADILSNYANLLRLSDRLLMSEDIFAVVLSLRPDRAEAHINMADLLWELGEPVEARRLYSLYMEMEPGAIPDRVRQRVEMTYQEPEVSTLVEILSIRPLSIEVIDWGEPVLIDSMRTLSSGGSVIHASRINHLYLSPDRGSMHAASGWEVTAASGNGPVAVEEAVFPGSNSFLFSPLGEDLGQMLTAISHNSDTLWSRELAGTGEFENVAAVRELSNGDCILRIDPDCWTTETYLARLSSAGELLWVRYLSSIQLLGLPGSALGESNPGISSLRETSEGDILACGKVAQWVTDDHAFFVCLLDGDTGETIWSALHHGLGEAEAIDVAETASGMIVAVGATAEGRSPGLGPRERRYPMLAVLDGSGSLLKVLALDLPEICCLQSVIQTEEGGDGFLVLSQDSTSSEAVLIEARIPTDPEFWGRLGPGVLSTDVRLN